MLALALVVGLAGGASAAEFNKFAEVGYLRVDTAVISSPSIPLSGVALIGQDRRIAIYTSSTDSVAATVWGLRSDGMKMTSTSATTPTSLTIASINGYQKLLVSPTSIGNNTLHLTVFQVK